MPEPDEAKGGSLRLAVIPGDGIGPEVTAEALKVLEQTVSSHGPTGVKFAPTRYDLGAERYLATGEVLPDSVLEEIRQHDVILLGAEVVAGRRELHTGGSMRGHRLLEHLQGLGRDLGPDPVTGDNRKPQRAAFRFIGFRHAAMLVVVRALTTVVSQVKRGLDGLGAPRALGIVLGWAPLGVQVVHRASPQRISVLERVVLRRR